MSHRRQAIEWTNNDSVRKHICLIMTPLFEYSNLMISNALFLTILVIEVSVFVWNEIYQI